MCTCQGRLCYAHRTTLAAAVLLFCYKPAAASESDFTSALVEAYAPVVYLATGENFLPSSIDWALENEQVLVNGTLAKSATGAPQPSTLNSSNLNFQSNANARSSYLTTDQSLGCDTCQDPAFLRGQNPAAQEVPVYAVIIQRDENTTSIYYWLFYPFNYGKDVGLCFNNLPEALLGEAVSKVTGWLNKVFGGSSSAVSVGVTGADAKLLSTSSSQSTASCEGFQEMIGNHVGDWEHVEVKFDSRPSPPTPEYVRLSQHDSGQIFDWGDTALGLQNGTHPIVYAANGSHANYASTGVHQYTNMTILDNIVGLTDTASQGIMWDTSEEVVMATWLSSFNYSGDQSWLGWPGFWGNQESGCTSNPISNIVYKASGECPLSSGLQGPAYYMGPDVN